MLQLLFFKMRNLGITILSVALTTVVISNAYYQKKQFYPTVVYITKSNPSMAIIYIQAFIIVILIGKLMRKVFFGELRPVELEHLMERSWYAVTETCLAFTVFRDDFSPKFVALFTLLLFLKSFHWLAEERVDFMERSPVISMLFHIRIISLLTVLGAFDVNFVSHAYDSTLTKGASVQLVFGFEYAILLTIIINIFIKYCLHSTDLHRELPWENKAVFLLYTELVMGFVKVILYIMFVFIMVRIYTLPLFAFRPMYYTVRAFKKAFNDVVLSRRAIRNMNTLYPDATPEELAAADNVCIICREEMNAGSASKKLPCNHIFHTSCLRSWFQRQQTCPTCRLNILLTPPSTNPPPAEGRPREQAANQPQPPPNYQWIPHQQNNLPGSGSADAGPDRPRPNLNDPLGFGVPPSAFQENPPYFYPPYPYLPYIVPPPIPPLDGLSDTELRRLERRTREGLEARIRCIQNIQCLLDAAMVMMQQYTAATADGLRDGNEDNSEENSSSPQESEEQNEGSVKSSPEANVPSGSGSEPNGENMASGSGTEKNGIVDEDKHSTFLSGGESSSGFTSQDSVGCSNASTSIPNAPKLTEEQEVARQQRLKKFWAISSSDSTD